MTFFCLKAFHLLRYKISNLGQNGMSYDSEYLYFCHPDCTKQKHKKLTDVRLYFRKSCGAKSYSCSD